MLENSPRGAAEANAAEPRHIGSTPRVIVDYLHCHITVSDGRAQRRTRAEPPICVDVGWVPIRTLRAHTWMFGATALTVPERFVVPPTSRSMLAGVLPGHVSGTACVVEAAGYPGRETVWGLVVVGRALWCCGWGVNNRGPMTANGIYQMIAAAAASAG